MIRLIVAVDRNLGLAKKGFQPWYIPDDEQYFSTQTKKYGGNILVGSTTYKTFRGPLAGRQNFVLTSHNEPIEGVTLVHDLTRFLEDFKDKDLWIVGGAKVFTEVIEAGRADELYITHIDADFKCDQFFPAFDQQFKLAEKSKTHEQNGFHFYYARYDKLK